MKLTREVLGNYDFVEVEFGPLMRRVTRARGVRALLSRETPVWRRVRSLVMPLYQSGAVTGGRGFGVGRF